MAGLAAGISKADVQQLWAQYRERALPDVAAAVPLFAEQLQLIEACGARLAAEADADEEKKPGAGQEAAEAVPAAVAEEGGDGA